MRARVQAASLVAWRGMLRARRQRRLTLALAAGIVLCVTSVATWMLWPWHATVGSVAAFAGRVEILPRGSTLWLPLPAPAAPLEAGTRLRSAAGAYVAIRFAVGSELRLAAGSEVQLHSARQLRLAAGRLYVDSGPAAARMEVATPVGVVRDVGTQFELWLQPAGLRVRVRAGKVLWAAQRGGDELECRAGNELTATASGHIARRSIAPFDPEWDWVNAMSEVPQIEGLTLARFLEWVARESGRPLRFEPPAARLQAERVILHGQAPQLAPEAALQAVLVATDFEYTRAPDGAILVRWRGAGR